MDFATVICWTSPFVILEMSDLVCRLFYFGWEILLTNSVDSEQTPHYMASDLGMHCLPMTLLRVSM